MTVGSDRDRRRDDHQNRRDCERNPLFDPGILERLALVGLGRAAGFSLEEIAGMFAGGRSRIDRSMLGGKADELDETIGKLSAMRDGLRHAAGCPAPSHMVA